MYDDHNDRLDNFTRGAAPDDEGGLRAPPDLHGWKKAWWWFHFLILVNLARLRFIAILVVIGLVIMKWDVLAAYYDKWTRSENSTEAASSDVEYFCPMHPTVVRDNNKEKCPICFMPLSRRKKGANTAETLPAGVVNRVQLSPYRIVLAGVQTWPLDYVPLTKEIKAVGFIEFNERGQRTVAARSTGRIDKLFANETGQMVNAGDDLALFYSQDLFVTIRNLIDAKRRGDKDFIESARMRLRLLGIDDAQIDELLAAGKPDSHVKIRSPISGHVITKYVKEGQYVQEGAPLYDVADLSTVWIQAQVYEDDLSLFPADIKHGQQNPDAPGLIVTATTRSFPNEPFRGKLAFIYPHVDQESRTVTVRFELENPDHKLRPGGTAEISIGIGPKDVPGIVQAADTHAANEMLAEGKVLAVPESAVIDTGRQKIVYREASPGVYEGVEVTLGPRMTDPKGVTFFPVLKGLEPGQRIVTSGSFLVDAETRLNPAAGSIYFGNSGGTKSAAPSVTTVRPSTPSEAQTGSSAESTIAASLAKLAPEDRTLAEAQRVCPITGSRLGTMGPPIKLTLNGEAIFLCCEGCKDEAQKNPKATLEKVVELRKGK